MVTRSLFWLSGLQNARYGRIEAHEAVTRGGREVLLRAKVAEEGFEVCTCMWTFCG